MISSKDTVSMAAVGAIGAGAGYQIAKSGLPTKLAATYKNSLGAQKELIGLFKGGVGEFQGFKTATGSAKGLITTVAGLSKEGNVEAGKLLSDQYKKVGEFIKGHNTLDDVGSIVKNGRESKAIAVKDTAYKVYDNVKAHVKETCTKGKSAIESFKGAENKTEFLQGKFNTLKDKVANQKTIKTVTEKAKNFMESDNKKELVSEKFTNIANKATKLFDKAKNGIENFAKADGATKTEMLKKLWGKNTVKGAVIGLAAGLLIAGAVKIFGKKSEE